MATILLTILTLPEIENKIFAIILLLKIHIPLWLEVITDVSMNNGVFWVVTPCIEATRRFGRTSPSSSSCFSLGLCFQSEE
jgi:hypothetical protein